MTPDEAQQRTRSAVAELGITRRRSRITMNEGEGNPIVTQKPRQSGVSGILSLVLPVFGFVIAYCAAHSSRGSYEGMRDAITGFAFWSVISFTGAICAFTSFWRHGFTGTSFLGLALCSAPFLYFFYVFAINSK